MVNVSLPLSRVKELAEAIERPPYSLRPELLWNAYEKLDKSKVVKTGPQKLLTNIISLVRFALEETEKLEPYSATVNERYNQWLSEHTVNCNEFTEEQIEWLNMIKDHIVSSMAIEVDDFELAPFNAKGWAS